MRPVLGFRDLRLVLGRSGQSGGGGCKFLARETLEKGWECGGLYIAPVAGSLQKHPRFFTRARGAHVSDRRGSAGPPIRVKLRTVRSARQAGGVHLALEPFREHFPTCYKNILFNY